MQPRPFLYLNHAVSIGKRPGAPPKRRERHQKLHRYGPHGGAVPANSPAFRAADPRTIDGRSALEVMTGAGAATGEHAVDAVVLAVDARGLRRPVGASPPLGGRERRRRITRLRSAPPFLVSRLWLDRPLNTDRPAFLGAGGLGPLDNVGVLDRYEDEARAWARRSGGRVVELHACALPTSPTRGRWATAGTADATNPSGDGERHGGRRGPRTPRGLPAVPFRRVRRPPYGDDAGPLPRPT